MAGKLDRYTIVIDGDNKKLELTAKNTITKLDGVGRAANDANRGTGNLSAGLRHASTNAAAFQGPLGGVSGRLGAMSTLLGSVNPAMVGLGLAISGTTLFMTGAIKEHDQFALRNKKQEALLKSTGNAAGFAGHELDAMAKAVALNTLASVEGIKDTQNVLLTFKGVSESAFTDAITLSQDMAAVMGTDSKAAALQLGKALESPTEGISALKRAGVSFTQSERDMIRAMEESGRVAEAQTYILETLKNQIGGAGAAEADTLSGAIDTFGQRWQELKINIADKSGVASGVKSFVSLMAEAANGWNKMLFPEDEVRFNELSTERIRLMERVKELEATGESSFFSTNVDLIWHAKKGLEEVTAEMEILQEKRKKQLIEVKAADDSAKEHQLKNSEELIALKASRDAEALAKIHTKNASEISAMDMKFADEEEKINLNYDKNLAKIESWQLSEEEIKRRGYENMEALRDEYRALADEKLNQDFMVLEEKLNEKHQKELASEAKLIADKEKMHERAAQIRMTMEASLNSNLMRLGHTLAGDNKRLQLLMLGVETVIGAKKAVVSGYVAGAAAAAALAGTGPQGPALAAAANASMIQMGYANAAVIGATGIAQGISVASGSSSGGSVSSTFESGIESNIQNNDEQITSINSASERRAGASVVYNGPYIEKVETMDSESFDQFAQRNSNSIARATAAGYEEYGVTLGA